MTIEELFYSTLKYIKKNVGNLGSTKHHVIVDQNNEDLLKSLISAFQLADLSSPVRIDNRLALAEISSSYLDKTPSQTLIIDFSFTSMDFLLVEGFVDDSGNKLSKILAYERYENAGAVNFISQIFDWIRSHFKGTVDDGKEIDLQVLQAIKDSAFATFKDFSHSMQKTIPKSEFGLEMNLEREKVVDYSSMDDAMTDFVAKIKSLGIDTLKLRVVVLGSASYDHNFQGKVKVSFAPSNFIIPNDPSRAKVRSSARLLKSLDLTKAHKVKLSDKTFTLDILFGNEKSTEKASVEFKEEFADKFELKISANDLEFVKGTIGGKSMFECKIDHKVNETQDYQLQFQVQASFEPELREISIPVAQSKCIYVFLIICKYAMIEDTISCCKLSKNVQFIHEKPCY